MTYLIVSDGPTYKIARLLVSHKNHDQVELFPEKISKKIKHEQKIYTINPIDINQFQLQLIEKITTIDSSLIWELIDNPYDKHFIADLALFYFGPQVNEVEQTALLFNLAAQTLEVINDNFGYFSKCSSIEQQKRQAILTQQEKAQKQFNEYYNALIKGQKPNFSIDLIKLLTKPDKHSILYKALVHRSKELGISVLELCYQVGLIDNLEQFFLHSFIYENFPQGINHLHDSNCLVTAFALPSNLTENLSVKVFSIDDSTTTEIDDAFSVTYTQSGYLVGIHIAAPALNPHLAQLAVTNISTIYYPGSKLTMLPKDIIDQFSLWEKRKVPVVSIYFALDQELNILNYTSSIEIVVIKNNLRIEELEQIFTANGLITDNHYPYANELQLLHSFANKLEQQRGKPSVSNLLIDYSFSFIQDKVYIKPRLRGNPIDKIVSELMILANGTWGRMLTNAFIPAIYRVKQINYPVTTTLSPASHCGLNVDYYTWATSPLRRAVDYINQRQIISLVSNNKAYYPITSPILLEVVENFDIKYAKYINFQNKMERYWSLKYLMQEQISEINATFIHKSKVQLADIPLELDLQGIMASKPKGTQIRLKIYNINLVNLTFAFKILLESI